MVKAYPCTLSDFVTVSLQAFLSRAAYYGMKGRYSKGIMSCNEAIKLQPRSVRAYLYRFCFLLFLTPVF